MKSNTSSSFANQILVQSQPFPPKELEDNIFFSKNTKIAGRNGINELWVFYSKIGAKIDRYYQLHLSAHANKVILIVNQEEGWSDDFDDIEQIIDSLKKKALQDANSQECFYRIFMLGNIYASVKTARYNLINILNTFEEIRKINDSKINESNHDQNPNVETYFNEFIEMARDCLKRFAVKNVKNSPFEKSPGDGVNRLPSSPNEEVSSESGGSPISSDGKVSPPESGGSPILTDGEISSQITQPATSLQSAISPLLEIDGDGPARYIDLSIDLSIVGKSQRNSPEKLPHIFEYERKEDIDFSEKNYHIYNSKDSPDEITKISKLVSDNPVVSDNLDDLIDDNQAIKSSVQDSIKSAITEFNNDEATKLKSYKYLLIAIYSQGVNKNEQYKKFLKSVNADLKKPEQLIYSDAKKLSLIFQEKSDSAKVFTGRIQENSNARLVGMRTKRIPLELLLETAKQDLGKSDFDELNNFKKTIKTIKGQFERPPIHFSSRKEPIAGNQSLSQSPISSASSSLSSPESLPLSPLGSSSLSLLGLSPPSSPESSSLSPLGLSPPSSPESLPPSSPESSPPSSPESSPDCRKLFPSPTASPPASRSRSLSPSRSLSLSLSPLPLPLLLRSTSQSLSPSSQSQLRSRSLSPRKLRPTSKSPSQSKLLFQETQPQNQYSESIDAPGVAPGVENCHPNQRSSNAIPINPLNPRASSPIHKPVSPALQSSFLNHQVKKNPFMSSKANIQPTQSLGGSKASKLPIHYSTRPGVLSTQSHRGFFRSLAQRAKVFLMGVEESPAQGSVKRGVPSTQPFNRVGRSRSMWANCVERR